jgi:glucose/mannose-6-phosphate isomerase
MNLDDLASFIKLDSQNMLGEIDNLPGQLQSAWELGQQPPLPDPRGITRILISGMGGSAIGADLLAAYIAACRIPVIIHRDYDLPAWARGPETLVFASSHSGNTEETLAVFEAAILTRCRILAVCTGGELE